jgi:sugar lactone lactonase YvrE
MLAAGAMAMVPAVAPAAGLNRPLQGSIGGFDHGPTALAVDQSNGDVYAVGTIGGENTISRFTAAGAPDNFTAGPAAGTNTFPGFGDRPLSVAIDNSGGPLNGDIYVAEGATHSFEAGKVEVFANDGASLGAIGGTGTGAAAFNNTICGIAVDQSSGDVYVSMRTGFTVGNGNVWRYKPTSPSGSISDSDYTLTGITADKPYNLAADSGNVYVQNVRDGVLGKYSASSFSSDFSTTPIPTVVDRGTLAVGVTAVAVDSKTGEVYADEGNRVAVFDSGGAFLYRFGLSAYFGARSRGIALKSAASGPATSVYVSDPRSDAKVIVFGAATNVKTLTSQEVASFGPDGSSASAFGSASPRGLAFDQGTRRLYTLKPNAPGIYGFGASNSPAYSPLAGFAPLATATTGGFPPGLAVDNTGLGSAGNLYLTDADTNLVYGWDSNGSPLGGAFPLDPALSPGSPNGSPKGLCGAAVDSAGNIWVANAPTKRILMYSSAGATLSGAIDTSAQGRPCRLAFDSNDDLYVVTEGGVWKYTAASNYSSATRVAEGVAEALAVDPSTDHLYVANAEGDSEHAPNSWVDEYDSAGNLINEFGTSLGSVSGIAVDATNHDVYVTDEGDHKIHAFGPSVLLPEVTARPPSDVTNTSVTLNGTVGSQEVAVEDCHFEYVSEAAFRLAGFSDLSSGGSVPCSPGAGSIPLDLEDHSVSATATGLSENTDYRFRLDASNANGTASAGGEFASAGRPSVETVGSPLRGATTARLEGRVDPGGKATTYHFEYGDQGPCDANPCESTEPLPAGSGKGIELVSQQIGGLQPATAYHYRVVADNGNPSGPAAGQDMTVVTRASDQPLSHGHFPGPAGSDRAWEQVNIPDTGGNPVNFAYAVSDNGERAFYRVSGGTPISGTGTTYSPLYAERTPSGWRSKNIYPPRDQLVAANWLEPSGRLDLSDQVTINFNNATGAQTIWRLRPGQPAAKVFEADVIGDSGPVLVADDASRVLLRGEGALDPAYPSPTSTYNLYDITSGTARLVGLLPDGSLPACDIQLSGPGGPSNVPRAEHWISPDGSLAFFQSCGNIYLRDFGTEQTKLIASGGNFIRSIPGAAFFSTASSLAPGDTGGTDVYRYDLGDEALKCLTCVVPNLDAAVTQGVVAADGSRVYFTSPTALVRGAATPGIYRVDVASGALAYVAPAAPGFGIGENPEAGEAISPDGSTLVFASDAPGLNALGGQQNGGTRQYYRYDDRDRSLTCLSCPQDGSAPLASVRLSTVGSTQGAGANKTALSADGKTFAFATPTALIPSDQNTARAGQEPDGGTDVYEWRDGRLLLVSDGLTNWPNGSEPRVSAVTPSGHDVFFVEAAQLTPDALDGYLRLYDARIGGGIEFPPPPKPCPLEVCQGTPKGAPEEPPPGTGSFAGPGNAHPPADRRKNKRRKHHKAKHQHKKQSRDQAKHNRRAP